MRITVLLENSVHRAGLRAEHGFSAHIRRGGNSILFDAGQTGLVASNAAALGIDLGGVEAVALSHGHYDHTGGLEAVLDAAPGARVFLHPEAFAAKYSRGSDGHARFIGMSGAIAAKVRSRENQVIPTPSPAQIGDGVFVTGEVPRLTWFEDVGGAFFLDAECARPDPLQDDQALVVDLGSELAVVLGCGHAGVVNTLEHARALMGGKPVRAVLGGMHLGSASEHRLEETVRYLQGLDLRLLAPAHCTGWAATARLLQAFPSVCRPADVGARFELPA